MLIDNFLALWRCKMLAEQDTAYVDEDNRGSYGCLC